VNNSNTTIIDARPQSASDRFEAALERLLQDQRKEEERAIEADAESAEAPSTEH
jgi:hypothetical protein